ncbi:sensor histidine kinase [Bowmanella denitrificans]|uniref:Sensor histidine kinase n=1 Tax=Bowmanella denitrificans TaxID=366582 RepID=A0ABP3GEH2_9ALTE
MIKLGSYRLSVETISGLISWAMVAGSSLYFMQQRLGVLHWRVGLLAGLYLGFVVFFALATREQCYSRDRQVRFALLFILFLLVVGIYFTSPYFYNAILMVMWSALLPYFMPFRLALLLSPLWSAVPYFVGEFYWQDDMSALSAMLFWTFNVFALVMVNVSLKEKSAKEAANQLNRELMAAQALLSEANKQAERTRIARNIHDLLGHHLTALSINLQVASRKAGGEVKLAVDKCHAIAGLLLSDVREAVSEIREKSAIQLRSALEVLTREVPRLKVHLDCQVEPEDIEQAHALLMCVQESLTNSLRHSQASQMHIGLYQTEQDVMLEMQDNGGGKGLLVPGNGLKGIRERIEAVGGKVEFRFNHQGMFTRASIPVTA